MRSIILISLVALRAFAALPAATVWEVRPTNGVDTNGGGFVTGASGTDFSQQNAAQYTFADLASTNGTTSPCIVSSASHSFVAADVGNVMQITAGTSWTTGFYEIVSVASNNATLDRACGSAASISGGTYAVGGALKTLTKMNGAMVAGNISWVKAESTITTTSTITINFANGTSGTMPAINGYTSSRGDGGQVTIQASASTSGNILTLSSAGVTLANFVVDCNSQTSTAGMTLNATGVRGWNVLVKNCTSTHGIAFNGETDCWQCTVTGQTAASDGGAFAILNNGQVHLCAFCVAESNSVTGFNSTSVNQFICLHCISANNSGASSHGYFSVMGTGQLVLLNCIAYKDGGDGIRASIGSQTGTTIINTITYGNTGWGVNVTTSQIPSGTRWFDYNSYGSNTSGNFTNFNAGTHDVSLTADPFVNGASNNFALNNTAGGGNALRGAGFPGTLAIGGTGAVDIGVLQHSGGGGQVGFPIVQ